MRCMMVYMVYTMYIPRHPLGENVKILTSNFYQNFNRSIFWHPLKLYLAVGF